MGLFVIGIGLFPTTITQLTNDLHNISSHGMLIAFLILMFALNRLVPAYSREFILIGYALGIAAIANLVAYFAGLYNYVIMEFILVVILGAWLYLFMRYTRILTNSDNPPALRSLGES